jgi:hypothetical protein
MKLIVKTEVSNHHAYHAWITIYTKNYVQGNFYKEMIDNTNQPIKPDLELIFIVIISIVLAIVLSISLII